MAPLKAKISVAAAASASGVKRIDGRRSNRQRTASPNMANHQKIAAKIEAALMLSGSAAGGAASWRVAACGDMARQLQRFHGGAARHTPRISRRGSWRGIACSGASLIGSNIGDACAENVRARQAA
jgi:hypothetical protein